MWLFSHRLTARHRPPNFYCEVAVRFRGGRCLVALRRLLHSRVRLASIAKGIEPYGWIRSRSLFDPEAGCPISRASNTLPLGVDHDDSIF
jgi:hypothetical protein